MKKIFSVFCILVLLATLLTQAAFADETDGGDFLGAAPDAGEPNDEAFQMLPFILEAPKYVFLDKFSDTATEQAINVAFSINKSMQGYFGLSEEDRAMAAAMNGFASLKLTTQIDWAIDDPEGWHYNEYWDYEGKDKNGKVVLGDWAYIGIVPNDKKLQSVSIFNDFGDAKDKANKSWNGDTGIKGFKDILPADLLKKKTTTEKNKEFNYIDWSEHTLYVRVRFEAITVGNDEQFEKNVYHSDWSQTVSFGKDVEEYYTPYMTGEDLPIPVLSDLTVETTDPEVGPVIRFNAAIPEEFEENALRAEVYHGVAHIVYGIRLNQASEFKVIYKDAVNGEVLITVKDLLEEGESYAEGGAVEVYALCWMDQYLGVGGQEWVGSIDGGFSEIISYGMEPEDPEVSPTPEITGTPEATPTPTLAPVNIPTPFSKEEKEAAEKEKPCPVCHLEADPQIFGVCMFILGGGVLLVIIIICIIVRVVRKKQDAKTDILFR